MPHMKRVSLDGPFHLLSSYTNLLEEKYFYDIVLTKVICIGK